MSAPAQEPLAQSLSGIEKDLGVRKVSSGGPSESQLSAVPVGREHLADALPPHESYEGNHRYDPSATWSPEEEARVVRKTDMYLLSWICVMVWFHICYFTCRSC